MPRSRQPSRRNGSCGEKLSKTGTNKPIPGITVYIDERETDTVVSERDGSFVLTVTAPGDFSVVGTGIGYAKSKPVKISVGGFLEPGQVILFLDPVYSMMEVVVEGDRNQDKTAKTVISGKELTSVAGSAGDPLRGMQALPGITTASDGGSNPAIRGSNPESNFYYVDFLPVGYLFHMGGLVSVINADLVSDFNIYSAAFGPEFFDVTGGVIDVKLRDPRQDRIGGKVNISLLEADALIEGPVADNKSFYLAARRSYFELVLENTIDEDGVTMQIPKYSDYQGKFLWQLSDDHTLTFQISGADDQLKFSVSEEAKEAEKDPVLAGNYSIGSSYNTAGVVLNSRLSSRVTNISGLSYIDTNVNLRLGQVGYVDVGKSIVFVRDNLNIAANARHDLLLGVDYALANVDIDLDLRDDIPSEWDPDTDYTSAERVLYKDKITANFWGLSLKDRWKIIEPLTLVIGQRTSYDDYQDISKIEPRLSAEYTFAADTVMTAGWGKYHEFPQDYQLIKKLGNPELNYPQADHYVLGVEHRITNGWSTKVEGYFKDLYNLVVPDETVNYVNGGSGRAYGVEMLIKKNRTGNWWGWISAAYAKTERHNDLTGETFASQYDQPYIVNLVYNWKITPKWTFGAKWRFQSGAPNTPVVDTYTDTSDPANPRIRPVYGSLGSERLPSYHRLDLRLGAEVWSGMQKLEWYVEIINAYNQKNVSGYEYNQTYTSREPILQLPIMPSVGFKLEF